ncbi:hypothetical protein YC2023_082179 [Brassica napus]
MAEAESFVPFQGIRNDVIWRLKSYKHDWISGFRAGFMYFHVSYLLLLQKVLLLERDEPAIFIGVAEPTVTMYTSIFNFAKDGRNQHLIALKENLIIYFKEGDTSLRLSISLTFCQLHHQARDIVFSSSVLSHQKALVLVPIYNGGRFASTLTYNLKSCVVSKFETINDCNYICLANFHWIIRGLSHPKFCVDPSQAGSVAFLLVRLSPESSGLSSSVSLDGTVVVRNLLFHAGGLFLCFFFTVGPGVRRRLTGCPHTKACRTLSVQRL